MPKKVEMIGTSYSTPSAPRCRHNTGDRLQSPRPHVASAGFVSFIQLLDGPPTSLQDVAGTSHDRNAPVRGKADPAR
jgi:hypothetical protein